jgi:4-hydroxybenzoate polyprenyltransferase
MIFARTAAMVFNRLADWEIDKRNPRTEARHRLLPRPAALMLLGCSSVAFVAVARFINPLCFALSPVALLIVFLYSLTKRFTHFSHFFLGLALSVSPVGAWLAVLGRFESAPLILALAVLLWVAGFDVIYATQDAEFDRSEGLHSLVVKLGLARSLRVAQGLHWLMLGALAAFGWAAGLGGIFFSGLAAIAGAIVFEHWSARRLDVEGINRAFFQSNAVVGALFLCAVAGDLMLRSPLPLR